MDKKLQRFERANRWLLLAVFFAVSQIAGCASDHKKNSKVKKSACHPKTENRSDR